MSLDPAILRALQAAGGTMDMVIAMVEADAALEEERLAKKRAGNRERQRRYREAHNADNALHDVTERDSALHASPGFLDKENPQTPKEINPSRVCEPRARPFHRLPMGWEPTRPLPLKTQAKVDQWPPGALADELAALHRWALNAKDENGKGRKKNWDTAWVNWIERRHDEHYGRSRTNGMGRHQPGDGLSPTARAAVAVFGAPEPGGPRPIPQ